MAGGAFGCRVEHMAASNLTLGSGSGRLRFSGLLEGSLSLSQNGLQNGRLVVPRDQGIFCPLVFPQRLPNSLKRLVGLPELEPGTKGL
jgi:hypothetical protein